MGFIFPKIFTKLFGSKEYPLLILCLDNPGKTTIKHQMQLDEAKVTVFKTIAKTGVGLEFF